MVFRYIGAGRGPGSDTIRRMHGATFVADLAVVLSMAAVTSVVARLLKQPTILGYLLAGLIVGPYVPIPVFADAERIQAMAEFGVILVMFAIGLEFRIVKLLRVLPLSGITGLVQVSCLVWCGLSLGQWLGWTTVESVFLGTAIAISSTMVVSKVFDQVPVAGDVREHVLGVLVIQDVVAIAFIAAMTAVAAGGGLSPAELASMLGQLGAVLIGLMVGGLLLVPRLIRAVMRLESAEILAVLVIGLCFGVALIAEKLGYSVALGAFIAGILVAESGQGAKIEHLIQPVRDMFAAIFFVSIGMTVDPRQVLAHLPTALLVFAVVIAAQLVSVTVASLVSGMGLRRAIVAGLALGQIGEFAFILASIGISAGAARESLQPILVTVAILTAFTTPLLLSRAEWVVDHVDRLFPKRVQHLLGLYQEWLARFRAGRGNAVQRSETRRVLGVLAFDAIGLIVMMAVAIAWLSRTSHWLAGYLDLEYGFVKPLLGAGVMVLSLPLLAGLYLNTVALSKLVSSTLVPPGAEVTSGVRIAGRTVQIIVCFAVVLGVGVPAVAVLRPLAGGVYMSLGLVAIVAVIGIWLWRSAGAMESEFRSGAEHIAQVLARQSGEDSLAEPKGTLADTSLLPGLDLVLRCAVAEGDYAVGKTLAELNLRALTNATVVAIQHHGHANVLLPTGRERLAPGDVLAITGAKEAIEQATALLGRGPDAIAGAGSSADTPV